MSARVHITVAYRVVAVTHSGEEITMRAYADKQEAMAHQTRCLASPDDNHVSPCEAMGFATVLVRSLNVVLPDRMFQNPQEDT